MADFILGKAGGRGCLSSPHEAEELVFSGRDAEGWVYGKEGTFCVARKGKDTIASIGFVCRPDLYSVRDTLLQTLETFEEAKVGELKKELVGEYILLIQKHSSLYIVSDFMGVRNIFYSESGQFCSSSFERMEDLVGTVPEDLDPYKVCEMIAMRHVLYPAWIGHSTCHRKIQWLRPWEYLVVDLDTTAFRLGSIVYALDNKKECDRSKLADELLATLRATVGCPEFKESPVAASMSGGRDSRLIGSVAAEYYTNMRFRTAYAVGHYDSTKDLKVAKKLARIRGIPHDVYRFEPGRDGERFLRQTEGLSPTYNNKLAPLIDGVGSYSLGLGGAFGTELFMPILWNSIDEFVQAGVTRAGKALKVGDDFWRSFRSTLFEEFRAIGEHFTLSREDERDRIRLFNLFDTARYSSFILSAFNGSGYQFDPFSSYRTLQLALRIAPALWGDHRLFAGDALVEQAAMARSNPQMARVLTYKNRRPMQPPTPGNFQLYFAGVVLQIADLIRRRLAGRVKVSTRSDVPGGCYLSDGWANQFVERTARKYRQDSAHSTAPIPLK